MTSQASSPPSSALVLIIDDDPQNLKLLSYTLSEAGYRVALANSGRVALESLQRRRPDLVLCDVVMPDLDGYEVCRQLKANPQFCDIPLIFLTSRTSTQDLLKGFQAGAVDYVTKPFSQAEVLARVQTHTALKQAQDTIKTKNAELEQLNQHLTVLNQEKNQFLTLAAHDLKNPLSTLMLRAEIAEESLINFQPAERDQIQDFLHKVRYDAQCMHAIVSNLLEINRIESGGVKIRPSRFDAVELVQDLAERYQPSALRKQLDLDLTLPETSLDIITDRLLVYQIADNLLSNAVKYSPPGGQIQVSLKQHATTAELIIQDQGPGFSLEDKSRMFQKFTRLSAQPTAGESSTGLGLSIVKQLTKLLKAELRLETEPGQGSRFLVNLPLQHPA